MTVSIVKVWATSWLCFLTAVLWYGCGPSREIADKSSINAYQNLDLDLNSEFKIFHVDTDSSRLFIKLNTKNLLYAKRSGETARAEVLVEIKPRTKDATKPSAAKAKTIRIIDTDDDKVAKALIASTTLDLPAGQAFIIDLKLLDVNRQRSQSVSITVDKSDPLNKQNFIAANSDMTVPLFTDRIKPKTNYILATNASPTGKIEVIYYKRNFPLPPPPFVAAYLPDRFDATPDSTFTLELNSRNQTDFTSGTYGFYHFQTDTSQNKGLTLFISPDEYPEVKNAINMVEPFRYLVGGKEYKEISESLALKAKLESYWIDWAGSKERARKSIKAYYGRVEDANMFFSSHVEGWKSDRGIIYIIYGKPNKVYKSEFLETWIYGEENNPLSITFNFAKVINPYTDNDFRLNREEFYKPSWYRSVNAWRDGRIY